MRETYGYLARAALIPGVLIALGIAAIWGPWSPLALDRANSLWAAGDLVAARAAYADVVDGWHFPATRAEGAYRAGVLAHQAGDVNAATEWMKRAVDLEPDDRRRATIRSQLANLYSIGLDDPAGAAEQYNRAGIESDDPRLLLTAGSWFERAGQIARAYTAYRTAAARLAAMDTNALVLARQGMIRTAGAAAGVAEGE